MLLSAFQAQMSERAGRTPAPRRQAGSRKARKWAGVRQKWKLLGVFQIDQQHEFYALTSMMKEGLAAAPQHGRRRDAPVSSSSGRRRPRRSRAWVICWCCWAAARQPKEAR